MWRLARIGMLPRIVNMVHDELIYLLYADELKTMIPIIEQEMIAGMRTATPNVKVGVGTSVCLHWDKKAIDYDKIVWRPDGLPDIQEPPLVTEVYAG